MFNNNYLYSKRSNCLEHEKILSGLHREIARLTQQCSGNQASCGGTIRSLGGTIIGFGGKCVSFSGKYLDLAPKLAVVTEKFKYFLREKQVGG